jgi:hypothetical protein
VTSGKISAAEVAQKVFDAMRENRFYIYSHPQALAAVRKRMEAIVEEPQPADPFSHKPEIREQLKAALR